MLRDRLPGRAQLVFSGKPAAKFEYRLAILFPKLIEDGPTSRLSEGLVHISHTEDDTQVAACMQVGTCMLVPVSPGRGS